MDAVTRTSFAQMIAALEHQDEQGKSWVSFDDYAVSLVDEREKFAHERALRRRRRGRATMKLYGFGPAASAQRVRVFLAEKGLDVPTEQLNVRDDDQFAAAFTAMNPFH